MPTTTRLFEEKNILRTLAKCLLNIKVAFIISRFGDANGERLEDYYLEQLIREELRAERVSKALFEMQLAGKEKSRIA